MGLTLAAGVAAGRESSSAALITGTPVCTCGCAIVPRVSGTKPSAPRFCVRSSRPNRLKTDGKETGQHSRKAAALHST